MRYRYLIIAFLLALVIASAEAARRPYRALKIDSVKMIRQYMDSLSVSERHLDSLIRNRSDRHLGIYDGQYFRLFVPLTFYHSPADKSLLLHSQQLGRDTIADAIDMALLDVYMHRPDLVKNTESSLERSGTLRNDVDVKMAQNVKMVEKVKDMPVMHHHEAVPVGVVIQKPNFWKFKGDGYLQFMQNFISNNWYKGGESNYSAVGSVTLEANYDNKNIWKWENKLEMKLGFQTSKSDTVHKFKSSEDLIRLTSQLQLRAAKNWYYNLQVIANTQFTKGLKSNDRKVYSDFASPLDVNVALGMNYKFTSKDKKLTGSISLSPLAMSYRYVGRLDLSTRFGLKEGRHSKVELGSQMMAELEWKFSDMFKWKSRLFGFTSYKRFLVEWENSFTLQVSRFISANVFVYPRFDDSGTRDEDIGFFQFKQYSSLGFSYSF